MPEHYFVFNDRDNGGEQLTLTTKFMGDEDEIYTNQVLTLNSYGNSASFNLYGTQITPEKLRDLANQLESMRDEISNS